jgi:hypothetical protein
MMTLPLKMPIFTSNLNGDLTDQNGNLKHQFFDDFTMNNGTIWAWVIWRMEF